MAMLALFFFVPFLMACRISLLDYSHDLYAPRFVGVANYIQLFQSPMFWQSLQNTFVFVLGVVPAMVALPVAMAVLLNTPLRGISIFRALIYLPVIVSLVVVGITWKFMLNSDGIVNYLFSLAGIPKIQWLVNPDIALYSVMIVVIWKGLAYYMMMYLANLQNASRDLYEAADIDGANLWQKHWYITVPYLRPTMAMVAIISTIGALKVFAEIYVMTGGGPVNATQTLVFYIYQRAFENLDLGIASAAGIILIVILIVLSLIQLRFSGEDTDTRPPIARNPKAAS